MLIADERLDVLDALVQRIATAGYRTLGANSSRAALDVFVRERPHTLIIHYGLLASTGAALVRRVRALAPAVPIIIQSRTLTRKQRQTVIRQLDINAIHDGEDREDLIELIDSALAANRCVERVRAEQDTRALILAKLCHNLRSPLDVVRGYTEMLLSDPMAGGFDEILVRLAGATEDAINILREYLDLARLEAPGLAARREEVDIHQLVEELCSLAGQQIGTRPVRVTASVPETGTFIFTDGEKLRAILAELLANAIKFTLVGDVQLIIKPGREHTDFVVADRGPGINEQDLPILFHPFRQHPDETLASLPGQGIGLALAERLSTVIGGSLTVKCGEKGGAAFTLSVPDALSHTLH